VAGEGSNRQGRRLIAYAIIADDGHRSQAPIHCSALGLGNLCRTTFASLKHSVNHRNLECCFRIVTTFRRVCGSRHIPQTVPFRTNRPGCEPRIEFRHDRE